MRKLIFTYCLLLFLFFAFCIYIYLAAQSQGEQNIDLTSHSISRPKPEFTSLTPSEEKALLLPFDRGVKLEMYSSCKLGETYIIQKDLMVLEYDYLQIPLVKPGLQAFDLTDGDLKNVRPELKIKKVGEIAKGDKVEIAFFIEEGGWIPCKGDWYMANPLVKVKTGKMAGEVFGISLLCDYQRDNQMSFKTGSIGYMQINSKYLKVK